MFLGRAGSPLLCWACAFAVAVGSCLGARTDDVALTALGLCPAGDVEKRYCDLEEPAQHSAFDPTPDGACLARQCRKEPLFLS